MSGWTGTLLGQGIQILLLLIVWLIRRKKISFETLDLVKKVQSDVVLQVEQISQMREMSSEEKKQMQMETQKEILSHYGITISDQWLSMVIEQQVFLMNRQFGDFLGGESKKEQESNQEKEDSNTNSEQS